MVSCIYLNRQVESQVYADELRQHPRNNQISDAPTPNTSLAHSIRHKNEGAASVEDTSAR